MKSELDYIFTTALLLGVVSKSSAKSETTFQIDRFYVTGGFSVYEAAEAFCEALGRRLATLPLHSELPEISEYLLNHGIAKVWVGAKLSYSIQECNLPQEFRPNCWEWKGFQGPQEITNSGAYWHPEVNSKVQSSVSRAFYDVLLQTLNFEDDTRKNGAICENYAL